MTLTAPELNELKTDIVKEFFAHDVIKVNTKTFFVLSSGFKLPIYLDHRRIFSIPSLRTKVIKAWASMLQEQIKEYHELVLEIPRSSRGMTSPSRGMTSPSRGMTSLSRGMTSPSRGMTSAANNADVVFSGTATAGIAPAYGLSSYFEAGFIYVRDKAKAHGLNTQIEGVVEPTNKFIVIDDMVVTGGSLLKNGIILQGLYGNKRVLCASAISCHESPKMRQTFEQNSIQFFPLFTTKEIFGTAHKTNVIDTSTFEILIDCLDVLEKNRS